LRLDSRNGRVHLDRWLPVVERRVRDEAVYHTPLEHQTAGRPAVLEKTQFIALSDALPRQRVDHARRHVRHADEHVDPQGEQVLFPRQGDVHCL
jgi:hypothetical protein